MRNPILNVIFILCAIYSGFFTMFIILNPHVFDCSDKVICDKPKTEIVDTSVIDKKLEEKWRCWNVTWCPHVDWRFYDSEDVCTYGWVYTDKYDEPFTKATLTTGVPGEYCEIYESDK